MPEQLLTILKLCLVAFVYLFFFRVIRAVWSEMSDPAALPSAAPGGSTTAGPSEQPARASTRDASARLAASKHQPRSLRVVGGTADQTFALGETLLIGRSHDCHITVDESFVSAFHAQVRTTPDGVVVDDLGSTNGTFVNRSPIDGPTVVRKGDTIGVGNVELEVC